MKALSPIPLYWVLKLTKPKQLEALENYQDKIWGLNLEIPPYPPTFVIAPVIVTTEQAAYLMRQKPKHPAQVK